MHQPTYKIALALSFWLEYTNLLAEGAINYIRDYPELIVEEVLLQKDPPAIAGMRPFPYDGLLTYANAHTDRWILDLYHDGIPVVNCSADFMDYSLPRVLGGNCSLQAADYLIQLGRPHIGFVHSARSADVFVDDHLRPLLSALQKHQLDVHRFAHTTSQPELTYEYLANPGEETALGRFLTELPKPASVWCLSDYLGVLVLRVARHLGLDIPGELAVLGVGGSRIGRVADPPLSTIPVPGEQIGAKAMSLLHDIILGKAPQDSGKVVIPCPPVLEQGSTRQILLDKNLAGQADALMREHACEGMTVNEVAVMLGVSRVTLTKHVEEAFGDAPSQRLRRYRLERAQQWLAVDGLNIARIAGMCGFNDQTKFYNFFKRETGMSPTAFRQRGTSG